MEKTTGKEIAWQAPSFPYYPKSFAWYAGFAVAAAGLLLFAVYSGGILTRILFSILVLIVLYFSSKKPRNLQVRLTELGIHYDDRFYPYKAVKKFGIVYEPPAVKALYLETTAYLNNTVKIELASQNPLEVRNFLKERLAEDPDQEESWADIVTRQLRF